MNTPTICRIAAALLLGVSVWATPSAAGPDADENPPKVYVPYRDLAAVLDEGAKAVLMERTEFQKLLDQARANPQAADSRRLAQVTDAQYQAVVTGQNLALTGTLKVVSLSESPVAVPMGFGRVGLLAVTLDGKPAPLGYDAGALVLLVSGRGEHEVTVSASAVLAEVPLAKFPAGGLQMGIAIPASVAGTMTLSAPGDLDISTTAASAKGQYDKAADRTTAVLTIGGRDAVTAVLLGNGRQEAAKPILVGESTTSVELGRNDQTLQCLFTVDVLRRSVRELEFSLEKGWTVTAVSCPDLVRWTVAPAGEGGEQVLTVRLRSASRGLQALRIKATSVAPVRGEWRSPRISLREAAFQRGYLLVNAGKELRVRGQELTDARREDVRSARVPEAFGLLTGRLYYHWGDRWSVKLRTAGLALRRESQDRQSLAVSDKALTLRGRFQVTAVGAEMFDLSVALPPASARWELTEVTVNGRTSGFEYHVTEAAAEAGAGGRTLRIELASPVAPEAVADVGVTLQHVPEGWTWPAGAPARQVVVPMMRCLADAVSGVVSVTGTGDLDAAAVSVAEALKSVNVGRMTSMGLAGEVQLAYTYDRDPAGAATLSISRRKARLAAESVGLVTVKPEGLEAAWRIRYDVTRAKTAELSLLAEASLGEQISISVPGRRIASRKRVSAAGAPDVWTIVLDAEAQGQVAVEVSYTRPLPAGTFALPLVRPRGADQVSEVLAVQASEELAVEASATDARWADSADLTLPPGASRVLAAWRFEAGGSPVVTLATTIHKPLAIPAALAASAALTTYVEPDGQQRTEAAFELVNAGLQFLSVRLDERASLWSISVDGQQAKPQRDTQGHYMVPLPRESRKVTVKVVYGARSGAADPVTLAAATLPGVKVNQVTWRVRTPRGQIITAQDTKMMTAGIHAPTPAYREVAGVLAQSAELGGVREMARRAPAPPVPCVDLPGKADEAQADGPEDKSLRATKGEQRGKGLDVPPGPASRPAQGGWGFDAAAALTAAGRYTLPVELEPAGWRGGETTFTALEQGDLVIHLTDEDVLDREGLLGFAAAGIGGLLCIRRKAGAKARLVVTLLVVTSLAATWWPAATACLNGMFYAGLAVGALYLAAGLARRIGGGGRRLAARKPLAATAGLLIVGVLCARAVAREANEAPAVEKPRAELVVPYEGDPAKAQQADKILVPYAKYMELWNQAHPEQAVEPPPAGGRVWLAEVRYAAAVEGDKLLLTLTCRVETLGKGYAVVPMPLEGLAVTGAWLDEAPVAVSAGGNGLVLTLPGGAKGTLRLTAVTTAKAAAGRPTVVMTLPPLPAGVMTVKLPGEDLLLEAPEAQGALTSRKVEGGAEWTVPLGIARRLSLRWSPKALGGTLDRTLSAQAAHEVHFQHWGLIGQTRLTYTFSATDYDQFRLLVPRGLRLTGVNGANLRDFAVTGAAQVGGRAFDVVLVRLHRSAAKSYEVTARWAGDLPKLETPFELALPQAGDVGRETGTVNLRAAGGLSLTEISAEGGRRRGGTDRGAEQADGPADSSRPLASYYWPYRPFALTLSLHRGQAEVSAALQQLVRLDGRRSQLLVQADLEAKRGRMFEAAFALPEGYEVLSAVGSAVDDHYVEPTPAGRRLYVNLRAGVTSARLALVLVRNNPALGQGPVPTVTALDAAGAPLARQSGRLAVQLAGALQGHTVGSENLQGIRPQALAGWLGDDDVKAVQFAYEYQRPAIALTLDVSPRPTRKAVEIVGGLSVSPTSAWYTYRLRYTIGGSPIDQVSFTLPAEYAPLAAVTSAAMRSVKVEDAPGGRKRWTVSLVNEVTGVVDVAVNFALPIGPKTDSLAVPRVQTDAPEGCQTVLAVQNLSRHELSAEASGELAPVPVSQQQALLGGQPPSLQYVFQSFATDWSLALKVKQAREAQRVTAVVDLMTVTTVIDREGNGRYLVELLLQNRSKQYLRMKVPAALAVWSAYVDAQAVKPVRAEQAGYEADEVLIPLIKTSATGLPYTVKVYLAGRACGALGGAMKIEPPTVRLVDIDVVRTIWTLRLPPGFRYAYPGGTMDEARTETLGQVHRIEGNLKALTSQVERYSSVGNEFSYAQVRGNDTVGRNWNTLNVRQEAVREELKTYADNNRASLGEEEYRKIQESIASNKEQQDKLRETWSKWQGQGQAGGNASINASVNSLNFNAGLAEAERDKALNRYTDFVENANRAQQEAIGADLRKSQEGATPGGNATGVAGTLGLRARNEDRGLMSENRADEGEALRALTDELEKDSKKQVAQQNTELSNKLSQLKDNRYARVYAGPNQPQAQWSVGSGVSGKPGDGGWHGDPAAVAKGEPGPAGEKSEAREEYAAHRTKDARELRLGAADMEAPAADIAGGRALGPRRGEPGGGAYARSTPDGKRLAGEGKDAAPDEPQAAMGTFSLPVDLPDIGVRKDFTSPGGDGTVTIWAIPDRPIAAGRSTAKVLTALLLLQCLLWAIRRLRKVGPAAGPARRAACYILLAAVGWVTWGLAPALVVALVAAALTEAARYVPRPSAS